MAKLNFLCEILLMAFVIIIYSSNLYADEPRLRFAVIPKALTNEFFLPMKTGCEQAAANLGNIECIYTGSNTADARAQNYIIDQLIEEGIDGIAVTPIHSQFLAENSLMKARVLNIPIISLNSDFDRSARDAYPNLRHAFVGTDNFKFGWKLGQIAKKFRPEGGRVCIISGHKSAPGLNRRVLGVRAALANISDELAIPDRLNHNQWTENPRCPLYSDDRSDRALSQLLYALRANAQDPKSIDTIIVVGAWPQQDADAFRKEVTLFKKSLESKKVVLVMGDAMKQQLQLLSENLAHANVGQNPTQMGYVAIKILQQISFGKPVADQNLVGLVRCLPDREPLCVRD